MNETLRHPRGTPERSESTTAFFHPLLEQLKQRRIELGLTQMEVDGKLGVADRLVAKWECGLRIPTMYSFSLWAEGLEMDVILRPKD